MSAPVLKIHELRAVPPVLVPEPEPFPESPAPAIFPVDCLPDILKDGVEAIAEMTQCDPAMAAASVLSAASLAAQRLMDVELLSGQKAPLTLFIATFARSGERKTSADNLALVAVHRREAELSKRYKAAKKRFDEHDKKSKEPPPELPPPGVLTTSVPTMQGLTHVYSKGEMGLGLFSNEGLAFLSGHAMGKDNKLATLATLSDLWDGKVLKIILSTKPIEVLPGRRLALHLMIQPDYGIAFINGKDTQHQGLAGRILVSYPKSRIGERLYQKASPEAEIKLAAYNNQIYNLLLEHTEDEDQILPTLALSPQAKALLIRFNDKNEVEAPGPLEAIQTFALKAAEHAARIAGVLQVVSDPGATEIQEGLMRSGIQITEYYIREALRISAENDPAETMAKTLLEKLIAKGKPLVTLSWIRQNIRVSGVSGKDTLLPLIHTLVEMEHLTPCEPGTLVDGKRRDEAWRVVGC